MVMQAARERILNRLAGMDLLRVFDLDGSGVIDPIVLARSLKIWDAVVFTEENVDDFLKWSKLEKERSAGSATAGIINIQDMIGFVKAHVPKLPRFRRRSRSRTSCSVASGASEAGGPAESFAAVPRTVPLPHDAMGSQTAEPKAKGRSSSRPPQLAVDAEPETAAFEKSNADGDAPKGAVENEVVAELSQPKAEPLRAASSDKVVHEDAQFKVLSDDQAEPPHDFDVPSRKLVARLAGLNILRVLDVDGNGLIDREVLKRSLEIFDPQIFTPDGVDKLINAASRAANAEPGSHVQIVDIARYMGTPILYPLTPESSTEPVQKAEKQDLNASGGWSPKWSGAIPVTLESATEPAPLTTADEMFFAALDAQSDVTSSGVLITARTEIESVAAEPDTVVIDFDDLLDGAPGCTIVHPEFRGITLRQLRWLMRYIEERCEREAWYDPVTHELLTAETIDLACLREWILKPATKDRQCSFVELVARRASEQRPTWYVSHCEGPVCDFIKSLSEHAKRHGFDDNVAYWVDAYAMNTWLEDNAGEGMWEKALAVSQGTVQVIGSGPVAYLEVGSHSLADVDTEPFYGLRFTT